MFLNMYFIYPVTRAAHQMEHASMKMNMINALDSLFLVFEDLIENNHQNLFNH